MVDVMLMDKYQNRSIFNNPCDMTWRLGWPNNFPEALWTQQPISWLLGFLIKRQFITPLNFGHVMWSTVWKCDFFLFWEEMRFVLMKLNIFVYYKIRNLRDKTNKVWKSKLYLSFQSQLGIRMMFLKWQMTR